MLQPAHDIKGLYLMTDYPAVTVRPGTTTTIPLRLRNYALAPERFSFRSAACRGLDRDAARRRPAGRGRDAGDRRQRRAAAAARRAGQCATGTAQTLTVTAKGRARPGELADRGVARQGPAGQAHHRRRKLPSLRGTSKSSFEYQLNIKNDSGRNLVVSFAARRRRISRRASPSVRQPGAVLDPDRRRAVQGRQAQGAAAEHHRRRPLSGVGQGHGRGRHRQDRTWRSRSSASRSSRSPAATGLLSARAEAGKQTLDPDRRHQHRHRAGREIELSGSAPSGWKVEFDPKTIDRIAPGKDTEVQALVTPTDKSIAGDYVTTIRATSRGETASAQFRVAVVDLDDVGHRRRRHHRRRAADHGGRGGEVRPPMSEQRDDHRHRRARPDQALRPRQRS